MFSPNCSGEFNEDQSLFTINCITTGDDQAIVSATYSINGNDMGNGKIYLQISISNDCASPQLNSHSILLYRH